MASKGFDYRKDVFGTIGKDISKDNPLIPAATVVLLRTRNGAPEVLMLQKNRNITFGGMWVFPGGRIDPQDHKNTIDELSAAKNAAVRETEEETGAKLSADSFKWISHWTPPDSTPKRFSTWFFVAEADDQAIQVDGGEILSHRWINPNEALQRHEAGEIELAPPTWITLYQLTRRDSVTDILDYFAQREPAYFHTHLMFDDDNIAIAVWDGDSAYRSNNPNEGSKRHRLKLKKGGFVFENNVISY